MARTRQYADRVNVIKMIKLDGKWQQFVMKGGEDRFPQATPERRLA
jgi:hypothetical protein